MNAMDLAVGRAGRGKPRRAVVLTVAVVAAVLAALVVSARLSPSGHGEPGLGLSRSDDDPATRMLATQFRVSSFNLLGAGHTPPGGDYASGYTRTGWAVQLIRENDLEVVGFQEMQPVQFDRFMALAGKEFGIFTGDEYADAAKANSLVWRLDTWKLVEKRVIKIPYFDGVEIRMPYVLLENLETNQRAWFSNFHNPANPAQYGDQEKWRDEATRREIALVNNLREEFPTTPVFMLGDMNEREEFFCRVARRTGMVAANGGGITADNVCVPPRIMPVDWVMGTPDVGFTQYNALRSELVQKTTDHPLVFADASIAPQSVQRSPIRRVVVVSVEGLRSAALGNLSPGEIPGFTRLMTHGAGTLDARAMAERTTALPNDVSMLTGRRVTATEFGHGIATATDDGGTVHQVKGFYVSSVFDLVHDFARRTAVFTSSPELALVNRSWGNTTYGGTDPTGLDDGRDKIDTYVADSLPGRVANKAAEALATRPAAFTFVQLDGPDRAGHAYGFASREYYGAVRRADRQLRRILAAINTNTATAGRTLVIVTSEHAGKGRDSSDPTVLGNARVPFFVFGPGVAQGADLYALNPHYTAPGRTVPGYLAPPPIRTAFVANLALTALGLPSVPGSRFDFEQDLNVYAGQ